MKTAALGLLAPLLLPQALWVRHRTPRLPEPPGPRAGLVPGQGAALRLLVLGDSSAAGVGTVHQRQALALPMARHLAQALSCPVGWQLHARSGLNTTQLLPFLQAQDVLPADVTVVVSGVNDVVDRISPMQAQEARAALHQHLLQVLGSRLVFYADLPPMDRFTALPQPLRGVAGRVALGHARALAQWAAAQEHAQVVPLPLDTRAELLASDGFHPGPAAYGLMAATLAQAVAQTWWAPAAGRRAAGTG